MSADVLAGRPEADRATVPAAGSVLALARREARRMLTSPAVGLLALYFILVGGVEMFSDFSSLTQAMFAEILGVLLLMFVVLVVFPAVHLTATSARRAGAEAQLTPSPMDALRRDMSLCVGVLVGPALAALALALLAAWVAAGVVQGPFDEPQIEPWTATEVAQWPAMALGAGILAIVVARWLRFPGSLLVGLVGMIFVTGWMVGDGGVTTPWFSWVGVDLLAGEGALPPASSVAWHIVYLFTWSALGVCAIGLRQAQRKRSWLVAMLVAAGLVLATGLIQLPSYAVRLTT